MQGYRIEQSQGASQSDHSPIANVKPLSFANMHCEM
jgi:hypothetical protein